MAASLVPDLKPFLGTRFQSPTEFHRISNNAFYDARIINTPYENIHFVWLRVPFRVYIYTHCWCRKGVVRHSIACAVSKIKVLGAPASFSQTTKIIWRNNGRGKYQLCGISFPEFTARLGFFESPIRVLLSGTTSQTSHHSRVGTEI